jgi:hypothetical protein
MIAGENKPDVRSTLPHNGDQLRKLVTAEPNNQDGTLRALPAKASGTEWQFEGIDEMDTEMAEA